MIFSITTSGVPSCSCPEKNSIITLSSPACTVCDSGSILSTFECRCGTGFFWSYSQVTCKSCSDDTNAQRTGGSRLHCACKANYIWDVVSQTCIEPCAANDYSCFSCSSDSNSDGSNAAFATSFPTLSRGIFEGGQSIKMILSVVGTNYAQLSKYQCVCSEGYLWDSLRLRCISALLK